MGGRFITFEGGEGAGKTTQMRHLAEYLEGRGIRVTSTREPGGTPRAEAVREVLLSGGLKAAGPEAEAMVFAAARVDHVDKMIRPALRSGQWVLCDRFTDSTRAYQGAADGVDMNLIRFLEKIAVGQTRPSLTIILDVPVEVGLRRVTERRAASGATAVDRFEDAEVERHERRRKAFLDIARQEPLRCVVIDAERDESEVAMDVRAVVEDRLLSAAA